MKLIGKRRSSSRVLAKIAQPPAPAAPPKAPLTSRVWQGLTSLATTIWAWCNAKAPVALKGIADRMMDPFHLKVYKGSLLTERSEKDMRWFTRILLIQLVVDLFAWTRAWSYGLTGEWYLYWPLGIVFALAILIFDRSVMVLDTSGSKRTLRLPYLGVITTRNSRYWPLVLRGVLLLVISAITSIPVELTIFEGESLRRIDHNQKAAVDTIRAKAIGEETKFFDLKIAEVQKAVPAAATGQALLQKQLDEYRMARTADRQQAASARLPDRAVKQAAVEAQRKSLNEEEQGKVTGSGRYGVGPAAQGMRDTLAAMEADVRIYDEATAAILTKFDEDTAAGVREREKASADSLAQDKGSAEASVAQLRKEREAKLDALRVLEPAALANKYGGDYRMSVGLLDRLRELSAMADENQYVARTILGCRLVMLLMGLLVLGMKAMSSQELKRYYSFAVQAARGTDTQVHALAAAMGYADENARRALGYDSTVADLYENLSEARLAVYDKMTEFWAEVRRLAVAKNSQDMYPRRAEIVSGLHQYWVSQVHPEVSALRDVEAECAIHGLSIPDWPVEYGVQSDPTQNPEPWMLTDMDLKIRGWQDPTPQKSKPLLDQLAEARLKLSSACTELLAEARQLARTRNGEVGLGLPISDIHTFLHDAWKDGVVWKLGQHGWTQSSQSFSMVACMAVLDEVEREFVAAGEVIPDWPDWLFPGRDPRRLNHTPWQIPVGELLAMGWEDPQPKIDRAKEALKSVTEKQLHVEHVVRELNDQLGQSVVNNSEAPFVFFVNAKEPMRLQFWREKVSPWLESIEFCATEVKAGGLAAPNWYPSFSQKDGWRVTRELLWRYGWHGEERPKHQPPPEPRAHTLPGTSGRRTPVPPTKGPLRPPPLSDVDPDAATEAAKRPPPPPGFVDRGIRSRTGQVR